MSATGLAKKIYRSFLFAGWSSSLLLLTMQWASATVTLDSLTVGSSGYKLEEDHVVTGDVTVNGGILDINGFKLTVNGNLLITGADSRLQMVNAADEVEVKGNATFAGASTKDYLSAGILTVGGNLTQQGNYNSDAYNPRLADNHNAFTATGTHKVVLNGSGPQTLSFESSSADYSHFQNLEINKPGQMTTLLSDDGETAEGDFSPNPPWGISLSPFEGNGCWADSPEGNYSNNSDVSLTSETLDLTSAQGAYLTFWHRYDVEQSKDYCKVEISVDDGSTWSQVASFTGKQLTWQAKLVDLSPYDGQAAVKIRFRLTSDQISNADGWYIDKIRVKSGPSVRLTGNAYIAGQWTLQSDATIKGNLTILGGAADMNGHALCVDGDWNVNETDVDINTGSLQVASLTIGSSVSFDLSGGHLYVDRNLTVNSDGSFDVNGGTLTVGNNMTVDGTAFSRASFDLDGTYLVIPGNLTVKGLFDVNGGTCVVSGDLTVDGAYALLKMVNDTDLVEVEGDALFKGQYTYLVQGGTTYAYMSSGTLKVGGDFTQFQGTYSSNFRASGTHKVVLNGTSLQTVTFQYPQDSFFQDLEITNVSSEGVAFASPLTVAGTFIYDENTELEFSAISSFGLTLLHDVSVSGDLTVDGTVDLAGFTLDVGSDLTVNLSGSFDVNGGNLTVGNDLTVEGSTNSNGSFDLDGSSLVIPGNLIIKGLFDVNGGTCVVSGDLTVDGFYALLKMVNDTDLVEVAGNAVFNGQSTYRVQGGTTYADLSAGTLKVEGDFSQFSRWFSMSFRASGTHKVILNGTSGQTVSFVNPGDSYFQDLEITNTSPEGVTFTSPLTVAGTFIYDENTELAFSGISTFGLTLLHDLSVSGNLTVDGPLDLAGKSLNITDNLTIIGLLNVNGGTCSVGGDLTVQGSNAYLKMINEADVVEVAGNALFYGHDTYWVDGETTHSYLSAGTLKVGGDFRQDSSWSNNYAYRSFRASGTHKVILDGTSGQTVSFSYPVNSYFQDLEITNTSPEGVTFTSALTVAGTFTYDENTELEFSAISSFGLMLLHDVSVSGDLTVDGPVDLAGFTLDVGGNLTINSGDSLDVNGGSLTVGNNMTVQGSFDLDGSYLSVPGNLTISGLFDVNGGTCSVGGDLTVQGNNAYLKMVNKVDVVEVAGNALFYGHNTYWVDGGTTHAYLSAGTLKVKGDFEQSYGWDNGYATACFRASGTHKVILDGTGKQTVSFQNPDVSYFQDLEITNTSTEGVVFTSPLAVAGDLIYGQTATVSFTQIGGFGLTLSHDQVLTGDLTVNGPLDLAGHTLTVSGNLAVNDSLDVHGGVLSVGGSVTVNGLLDVNGGSCSVVGDLTVTGSNAYLQMVNALDMVEVGGKVTFNGHDTYWVDGAGTHEYLSAGTLKVKGDFEQHSDYWQGNAPVSFRASGTHKAILNGTGKQTVSFTNPDVSYFQDLEIANTSAEGVVFTSPLAVAGAFTYGPATTISFSQVGGFGLTLSHDQVLTGDLTVNGPLDLAGHTLAVTGNVSIWDSLDMSGGVLSVGGSVTVYGLLDVNAGSCSVDGDLTVTGSNAYLQMVNALDVVEVGGKATFFGHNTYWVDGAGTHEYLSAGTLKVKGDFEQHSDYWQGNAPVSFRASGTHKAILNGTGKQTVSFTNPDVSYFQDLEITNTSAEGVIFIPDKRIICMGELSIINSKATGIDRKPQITSLLTATTWFRDVPNLYQVTADDPDLLDPGFGEILTISVDPESIAKGVKITSGSLIYWTPDRTQVGEHTMIVTVTDKAGALGKQSVTVAVAHPLFESPDNDTMAQATPIAVPNRMLKADLSVPSGTAKDVDYYKITLADNRKIRVSMITLGSNKYLLDVLDSQGTSAATISLAGNAAYPVEERVDLGLTTGSYYLKVLADQATYNAAQVYGLGYVDLEGFVPPEQTVTVNYGTAYQDVLLNTQDRRYYLLSLTQPGALFIAFTNPTQSDNRFLLKDGQGGVLEIFRLSVGLDLSAKVNLTSGDYTLAMEPAGYIDASEPFLLTFTSGPVDDGLEVEPNDTFPQANAIEVGKTMGGTISDDTDTDYYKLTLSTTKMLDFTFKTASSAPGHYNVDILIGDTVINHITAPGSGASSTLSAGLYPGDYFLRVIGTGVSSADDYTIEITEVANVDRETEGNNTKAFANGLTAGTRKQARTHSDTDIDFFGVTFSSYGYFGITIKPMTQGVNFNVKVYNAEDRILMNFGTQGSGEAYEELYLWPGNYYVEVTGTHEGDYTLLFEGEGSALKELVKLAIVEAPQQIDVGKTAPLNLVGSYTDGSVIDLSTAQVNWTTSDAAKATVSGNVVSGIAAGPATIYANYGGQMAKVDLVVGGSVVDQKQAYGNLILLAGGGAAVTNTMKEATQYLANMVYSRFLGRGFRMEDIFYFNPVPWQDINGDGYGDPVVTEKTPTVVGLRSAIETWAAQQASTGPLYLVLIDHGGIDTFEVFPGEVITASQVHESLSVFQSLTGREAVVMIEACKSGSFADDLAPAGSDRMVLTCTDEGNAYLELKGRISFTQFLMDRLFSGDTFRQSYLKTITKLSACGRPYSLMAPRLVEGKTFVLSQVRLGGNFVIAGIFPEILNQTEDMDVTAGSTVQFGVTISDLSGQTKVWAVVEPPDYVPPGEVGDLEAPEVSLPTFDLTDEMNGVLDGIFEGSYGDFVYNGEHRIVFYARNADGLVSASPSTIVTVTGGTDIPKVAGDLDADGFVTLADAIIGMRVLSGQGPAWVNKKAEVNGDGRIGMAEVVFIMQTVSGLR